MDKLFDEIKKRYSELQNSCDKESFINHLRALSLWNKEPMDYPAFESPVFPEDVQIAHVACHPDCGAQSFIVDGGPQRCSFCGRQMFRGETKKYKLTE